MVKEFEGLPLVSASQIRKWIPSEYKTEYRRSNALKRRNRHLSVDTALNGSDCHDRTDKNILDILCQDIKAVGNSLQINVVTSGNELVRIEVDACKDSIPIASENPPNMTQMIISIDEEGYIDEESPSSCE